MIKRCANIHHAGYHGGLRSLHPVECKALELGLNVSINQENAQKVANRITANLGLLDVKVVVLTRRSVKKLGQYSYISRVLTLNLRTAGSRLDILAHELAHAYTWDTSVAKHVPHGVVFRRSLEAIINLISGMQKEGKIA